MFYEIYEASSKITDTVQARSSREAATRYCQATGCKGLIKITAFHYIGSEKYKACEGKWYRIIKL